MQMATFQCGIVVMQLRSVFELTTSVLGHQNNDEIYGYPDE